MAPSAWLGLDSVHPSTCNGRTTNNLLPKTLTYMSWRLAAMVPPAWSLGQGPVQSQVFSRNSKKEMLTDADGSETHERCWPSFVIREGKLKRADVFRLWRSEQLRTLPDNAGKWIFSHLTSGSVNWNSACRGQLAAPGKMTNACALWPRIPPVIIYPAYTGSHLKPRLSKVTHCHVACNSGWFENANTYRRGQLNEL